MFTLPALILLAGVVLIAGLAAGQHELTRRRALREAIRSNPGDYVAGRFNQDEAPRQQGLRRQLQVAGTEVTRATARLTLLGEELPSVPPRQRHVVFVAMMGSFWVCAFLAQCWLDYRISYAITGNVLSAGLITVIVSGLLAATTLTAAKLWDDRSNAADPRRTVYLLVALFAVFAATLSLLAMLAPKRAEMDFAESVQKAKQSVAKFQEDGDQAAEKLAQLNVERLETERAQAASFYQVATVVAGTLEGGTSLVVPSAVILLSYFSALAAVKQKEDLQRRAQAEIARSGERFLVRIARDLERAGITQNQLPGLVAQATQQNAPAIPPALEQAPGAVLQAPEPARTQVPATAPAPAESAPATDTAAAPAPPAPAAPGSVSPSGAVAVLAHDGTDGDRRRDDADDAPDPTFDLT